MRPIVAFLICFSFLPVYLMATCGRGGGDDIFYRHQGGADNRGQVAKIVAPDATDGDEFGCSNSMGANAAIAGTDRKDAGGSNDGVAYICSSGVRLEKGDRQNPSFRGETGVRALFRWTGTPVHQGT